MYMYIAHAVNTYYNFIVSIAFLFFGNSTLVSLCLVLRPQW